MTTKLPKLNFWGYCAITVITIAFVGLFFGRKIQQSIDLSPLQFALILFFSGAVAYRYLTIPRSIRTEIFSTSALKLSIATYLAFAVAIYLYVPYKIEMTHFFQFSLLSIALVFWLATEKQTLTQKDSLIVTIKCSLISIAIGSLEEYLQLYVPNRFFDWRDIYLNTLSSIFGGVLAYFSLKKVSRQVV